MVCSEYTFTIVPKLSKYVSEKSNCLPFTISFLFCADNLVAYSKLALVFELYIDAVTVSLLPYGASLFMILSLDRMMLSFYSSMCRKTRSQLSPKERDFCDIKTDINPKCWLSRYRRTSIGYLFKMLLFYHGIGLLLMLAGTSIVKEVISNYEEPSLTRYLSLVLSAGPVEETLFFGIPYYAFGNHFVVLGGGIVWAMLHILNTHTLDIRNLAYANWLFVIPSFFFSFRTWISGKGWFAIITHSGWNGIFFTLGCVHHDYSCLIIPGGGALALSNIILSIVLVGLTYALYKRSQFSPKFQNS